MAKRQGAQRWRRDYCKDGKTKIAPQRFLDFRDRYNYLD